VTSSDRARSLERFRAAINMSADEIEAWLDTPESRRVGHTRPGAAESIGRAAARETVRILRTPEPELTEEDYLHMRKVAGYVARHRAQEPANPFTSRWRWSLMNWGHDPLREWRSESE
jgi:hypothetical protein